MNKASGDSDRNFAQIPRLKGRRVLFMIMFIFIGLFLFNDVSLAALPSVKDYFQISYEPVIFSSAEIVGNKIFYAQIKGKAVAIKNFPAPVGEVRIISSIAAQNQKTKNERLINTNYTINIKPFPKKKGQFYEINKQIPLRFSGKIPSGDYLLIGKIIKAEAKVSFLGWQDITKYLPQTREMGTVKYIAKEIKNLELRNGF